MAVATLAMIFICSARLALVVPTALLLYATLRLTLYRMFRDRSEEAIQSKARESSTFIETARAIQSIKLFNRESEREGQWLNRYAHVVNANVRLGQATITFKTLNDAIFGIESLITVYLAARLALGGAMTVGMIFGRISPRRRFCYGADFGVRIDESFWRINIIGDYPPVQRWAS
jgi:ATP-binding cassette, subfamily B, bacterial CvaB/MchF/RaxB